MKNKRFYYFLALLFGVFCLITFYFQIIYTSNTTTKLDNTLFGILQFIFSIAFSWIISKISSSDDFKNSQKSFALSAYRRIIEINNGIDQIIGRINTKRTKQDSSTDNELEVVYEIATTIKRTITSSIADWGDIIGEEIETMEKIIGNKDDKPTDGDFSNSSCSEQEYDNKAVNEYVNLPPSLKIISRSINPREEFFISESNKLIKKYNEMGYFPLNAMWLSRGGFDKSIEDYNVGDVLKLSIGDRGLRIGVLLVQDENRNAVGVVLADILHSSEKINYYDFLEILKRAFNKSEFTVRLVDIGEKQNCTTNNNEKYERIYFCVNIE